MERGKLSENAYAMLLAGKKVDTIKGRDEIKKVFEEEALPVYDKVIDFQEQFGGIWYRIGEEFYKGFEMDMFYYHDFKGKHVLKYFTQKDGRYLFQCMTYHYAGDIGPCIDEEGKIYRCAMGHFPVCADSIEEFLEDEAMRFYIAAKRPSWLTSSVETKRFDNFKNANRLLKIEREVFTDKYFQWWENTEQTILVRVDLAKNSLYAELYCKDQEVLNKCKGK